MTIPSHLSALRVLAGVALMLVLAPAGSSLRAQPAAAPQKQADELAKNGMARLTNGDTKAAVEAFRAALKLDPLNQQALVGLVEIRLKEGPEHDPKESVALLEAAIGRQPARKDLRAMLGNVLVRLQQYDAAIAQYQMALDLETVAPAKGDLYLRIGEAARRKGDLQTAAQAVGRAHKLMPENLAVSSTMALVLDQIGDHEAAAKAYRDVIQQNPNNAVALNNLAWMLSQDGDLDSSLPLAQRARQILPNEANILDTLGTIYLMKNRIDDALGVLRDILDKDPSQAGHLALGLSAKGARAAVVEALNAALANSPAPRKEQQIRKVLADLPAALR